LLSSCAEDLAGKAIDFESLQVVTTDLSNHADSGEVISRLSDGAAKYGFSTVSKDNMGNGNYLIPLYYDSPELNEFLTTKLLLEDGAVIVKEGNNIIVAGVNTQELIKGLEYFIYESNGEECTHLKRSVATNCDLIKPRIEYIKISTCEELQNIEKNKNYELYSNINCTGFAFSSIPGPFEGTLEGNRYTINGLTISKIDDNHGLFSEVGTSGIVRNIKFTDISIKAKNNAGAVAGINRGKISNIEVSGNIEKQSRQIGWDEYGYHIGGIAGINHGTIENTYVNGDIYARWLAGGIAGHNAGQIKTSWSNGTIKSSYGGNGGLVGYNNGNIQNSYSIARIPSSLNAYSGGLVGYNYGNISKCYATGAVGLTRYNFHGGLVGNNKGNIFDSFAIGMSAGGLVGLKEAGKINNSYTINSPCVAQGNADGCVVNEFFLYVRGSQPLISFSPQIWDFSNSLPKLKKNDSYKKIYNADFILLNKQNTVYEIMEDITGSIKVTGKDITINGNGHTIGPASTSQITGNAVATNTNNQQVIFLSSSNVQGYDTTFSNGVLVDQSNHISFSNCIFTNSNPSLSIINSNNIQVEQGEFRDNTEDVTIEDSHHVTINNNKFIGSSSDKNIYIHPTSGNVDYIYITNNEFQSCSNSGSGISGWIANKLTVKDNTIENCKVGIFLKHFEDSLIESNILKNNGNDAAIALESCKNSKIKTNNIHSNANKGIEIKFSDSIEISDNIVSRNTGHGVYTKESSFTSLFNNNIKDNGGYGIYIEKGGVDVINGNTLSPRGVYVNSDDTTIEGNDFSGVKAAVIDNSNNIIFVNNYISSSRQTTGGIIEIRSNGGKYTENSISGEGEGFSIHGSNNVLKNNKVELQDDDYNNGLSFAYQVGGSNNLLIYTDNPLDGLVNNNIMWKLQAGDYEGKFVHGDTIQIYYDQYDVRAYVNKEVFGYPFLMHKAEITFTNFYTSGDSAIYKDQEICSNCQILEGQLLPDTDIEVLRFETFEGFSGSNTEYKIKTRPVCGDGITQTEGADGLYDTDDDEECDDGNRYNTDLCNNTCKETDCGDNVVQSPNAQGVNEECDDGSNQINTDACLDNCLFTHCGDGYLQSTNGRGQTEECDGNDFGGIESCADLNLYGDNFTCNNQCKIEGCYATRIISNTLKVPWDHKDKHYLSRGTSEATDTTDYEEQGLSELHNKANDPFMTGDETGLITIYDPLIVKTVVEIQPGTDPSNIRLFLHATIHDESNTPSSTIINIKTVSSCPIISPNNYLCTHDWSAGTHRTSKVFVEAEIKEGSDSIDTMKSGELIVAKYILHPLAVDENNDNFAEDYDYYNQLSDINKKIKYSCKPVIKNIRATTTVQPSNRQILGYTQNPAQFGSENIPIKNKIIQYGYNPNYDKIVIYTNPIYTSILCNGFNRAASPGAGCINGVNGDTIIITPYLNPHTGRYITLAHELGHAFGLNDEYSKLHWTGQGTAINPKGPSVAGMSDVRYPKCCQNLPSCCAYNVQTIDTSGNTIRTETEFQWISQSACSALDNTIISTTPNYIKKITNTEILDVIRTRMFWDGIVASTGYPPLAQGFCGNDVYCVGMPYEDLAGNVPNDITYDPANAVAYSIMGAKRDQGLVYPLNAACPLRGCT